MTTHRSADGLEEFRLTDDVIEARTRSTIHSGWGEWSVRSRRSLLAHPVRSPVWNWLRSEGIRRPAPSGKSGAGSTHKERQADGRTRLEVYLSPKARKALERLVRRHGTKTSAVECALIRADSDDS
jgi:hypothetical protein